MLGLTRELQREARMAVPFITHDLGIVAEIADHVAMKYAGHIVENTPVAELFARPLHPYTQALVASIRAPPGDR
jgi:peptide/nickel transport system ATP-binding protein